MRRIKEIECILTQLQKELHSSGVWNLGTMQEKCESILEYIKEINELKTPKQLDYSDLVGEEICGKFKKINQDSGFSDDEFVVNVDIKTITQFKDSNSYLVNDEFAVPFSIVYRMVTKLDQSKT